MNRRAGASAPFLVGAYAVRERIDAAEGFPRTLAFVPELDLTLDERVTIFVGENGSGKSTLLEAIAELVGLPWDGGSGNELASSEASSQRLAPLLRPKIRLKPPDKYFFRAEALSDFGRLLEAREEDPDFLGDPYTLYGGRSIRTRSHGEGVRALLQSRDRGGLFLLDEPESALSPLRQEELIRLLEERAATGSYQFIVATHSPLLMAIRGARLISMDDPKLPDIRPEATSHWRTYAKLFRGP